MIFPEGDDDDDDDDDDDTAMCFCFSISYINIILLYAYAHYLTLTHAFLPNFFISLHRLHEYQLVVCKSFWTGLAPSQQAHSGPIAYLSSMPRELFLPTPPYLLLPPHTKCKNTVFSFFVSPPYIIRKLFLDPELFLRFIKSRTLFCI